MHRPPKALVAFVALAIVATALPVGTLPLLDDLRSRVGGDPPPARAAVLQSFSSEGSRPIAPGVTHDWGAIGTGSGRQVVHMVNVTGGASGITFEAAMSNDAVVGLERTTSMANRQSFEGHRAVAAINGDVWSASSAGANAAPFGLHVQNSELMTAGPFGRPTFGITEAGQPLIGAPVVSTHLVLGDGTFQQLDRVNQRRQAGEVVLYTPRFGSRTDSEASGIDVVLSGVPLPLRVNTNAPVFVTEVRPAGGNIPIAPDTVVVTGPDTSFLSGLTVGTQLTLTVSITSGWETVRQAIGGREFLLRGGSTFLSPRPAIADERHPRTAIGIRADGGVVLATVDGRRSGYSLGVTNAELATVLASQGATDAINLDGGGSTAMAVRQPGDLGVSIVNRPSDGGERVLPNALVVYSAAPTGPLAYLHLRSSTSSIYTNGTVDFTLKGQDAAYNGVVVTPSQAAWSITGAGGTFDANGRFSATTPGSGTVTATLNGVTATAQVSVLADSSPPSAEPPNVRLLVGQQLGSTLPAYVSWGAASDIGLGVAGYELQANANGAGWIPMPSGSALNRYARPNLIRNGTYRFAVRASDKAGNVGGFAPGSSFRVVTLSEASGSISYSKGWSAITSPSYDGKRAMSTRTPGAFATYSFVGTDFAWISTKSPVRGAARVYVDGKLAGTVNLNSKSTLVRQIVFSRSWSSLARHTIRIEAVGTSASPRVDIDAFVLLAAPVTPLPAPGQTPPPAPTPSPTPTPTPDPNPTPTPTPGPTPSPTPTPSPVAEAVLVGAGDIASCGLTADTATGKLVAAIPGIVFTAGDNAYESGTAAEFRDCYDPAWGAVKGRTRPVPGNHDYVTSGASAYYAYFGALAGDNGRGWYAYDAGAWRIYALNSNCTAAGVGGCGPGSEQETWLLNDLAANPRQCVAAIWHHPRFSSGDHGNSTAMASIFTHLYNAGADLVLTGHDHNYERFAPIRPDGAIDTARGMRQFVIGTGGASLRALGAIQPSSEVRSSAAHGVLKLTLRASDYSWEFVPIAGRTFTDAGTTACH
jgi:hypothetical protein